MTQPPSAFLQALPADLRSRLDFTAFFRQDGRLMKVKTALPDLALIPEALAGSEQVNDADLMCFSFQLDCLSTSAHFELKQLIGEQITLELLQPSGHYRQVHGYVLACAQLGSDGGLARYRLSLGSFGAFLQLRRDSFIYQDKDARHHKPLTAQRSAWRGINAELDTQGWGTLCADCGMLPFQRRAHAPNTSVDPG